MNQNLSPVHGAIQMKKIISLCMIALLAIGTAGCYTGRTFTASQTVCNDPVFLELKSKPVSSLSDREFQQLLQYEKECAQSQQTDAVNSQSSEIAKQTTNANESFYATIFLGVPFVLILILSATQRSLP